MIPKYYWKKEKAGKGSVVMLKRIDGSVLLNLKPFDKVELKLFLYIAKRIGMMGGHTISLSLRELISHKILPVTSEKKQVQLIEQFSSDASIVKCHINEDGRNSRFSLFISITYIEEYKAIEIQAHPKLISIFVDIYKNWTIEDLLLNNQLASDYSRSLYTLFKYNNTGEVRVSLEELRNFLFMGDTPISYQETSKLFQKVINPALKELQPYFKKLNVKKVRTSHSITHVEFTFDKE